MKSVRHTINNLEPSIKLKQLIEGESQSIELRGLVGALSSFIISDLFDTIGRTILIVTSGPLSAETMLDDLSSIVGSKSIGFLPPAHLYPFETVPIGKGPRNERVDALIRLRTGKPTIMVTQPESLLERGPDREWIEDHTHRYCVGDEIDRDALLIYLAKAEYKRERLIDSQGQYAVRGGLVDLFPFGYEKPVRMELDGDEIVSLRSFEPTTQRSVGELDEIVLLIDEKSGNSSGDLLSLLQDDAILFWMEMDEIEARIEKFHDLAKKSHSKSRSMDKLPPMAAYMSFEEILSKAESYQQITFAGAFHKHLKRKSRAVTIDFNARTPDPTLSGLEQLPVRLKKMLGSYGEVWIAAESSGEKERLEELFLEEELHELLIAEISVSSGFLLTKSDVALLTSHKLFNRRRLKSLHTRFRRKAVQFDRTSLKIGDMVVHSDHGIGIYEGLQAVKVRSQSRECLRIKYKEGNILYIPVENFGLVEKYMGASGGVKPKISRLGTGEWARTKKRTRKALEDMAGELLKLYAQRKIIKGHAFSEDTHWQKEMEDSFEFEDTPGQIDATSEIKRDLEATYPMDRLLCGDVGFGKTEVAVRSAFKIVQDSFQVAILVPTTILAQQHYETFRERLGAYPVRIEMLSRFRTPTEQKQIIAELGNGQMDIVIGTHRLLSKDVRFKKLGLVIVDEEHRFGVRHKEKLKQLKTNVGVLTMTATPIPRTLHLALMGARDTSQINTPPVDRLPIQTDIYPFSENLIREAILREVDRNGQVFFLHNRVESIYAVQTMLERLLPEVRFVVAHGQMPERQLENVMLNFMNYNYDVLITTTIIESGIDIPNANTLIVNRADRLGLAQLYQIRGRIGRSNRQAYAYLLTPPRLATTTEAKQRLSTLSELTDLGSGLKIAMRDLEIRGAGNLLGSQQSGYINAVGFELYTRMLNDTVQELKGTVEDTDDLDAGEIKIDYDGPALISHDYIEDGDLRYHFYHRLSLAEDMEEIELLSEEIKDRFGKMPVPTRNLFEITRLKQLCRLARLKRLIVEKSTLIGVVNLPSGDDQVKNQRLLRSIVTEIDPEQIEFRIGKNIEIIYRLTSKDRLIQTRNMLLHLTRNGKLKV